MKLIRFIHCLCLTTLLPFMACSVFAGGVELAPGQNAPEFSLTDLSNKKYDSRSLLEQEKWMVYYFFDIESKVCREGLSFFTRMPQRVHENVKIVAITANRSEKLTSFFHDVPSPVLLLIDENEEVSASYYSLTIFPKTYIINSAGTIVEVVVGSDGSVQSVVTSLLDKYVLNNDLDNANALLQEADLKNEAGESNSLRDRINATLGYAKLKAGKGDEAEQHFSDIGDPVLKKEGLAAVAYEQGDDSKTSDYTGQLLQQNPENGYAHTLNAKMKFRKGDVNEAVTDYEKAVNGTSSLPWQKAEAVNNMGRALARLDKPQEAVEQYDKALSIYPEFVIPMSNKGVALNRAGRFEDAELALAQAGRLAPQSTIINTLIEKNNEDLAFSKNFEKQHYVQNLVKKLVQRHELMSREQQDPKAAEKEWTSPPLTVSFLPPQVQENNPEFDGDSIILHKTIEDSLKEIKRVKVVDRQVIDKLLEELHIGSSELSDKKQQLKLGKILAARVLLAGDVLMGSDHRYYVTLRSIETETSEVLGSKNFHLAGLNEIPRLQDFTSQTLSPILSQKFPFRGKIVSVSGDDVIVNLGTNSGLYEGVSFEVLDQGEPVIFEGEILGYKNRKVAEIKVVEVLEKMANARIVTKDGEVKQGMKCQEI